MAHEIISAKKELEELRIKGEAQRAAQKGEESRTTLALAGSKTHPERAAAWSHQKEWKEKEVPTQEELYNTIMRSNSLKNRAFLSLLYLTGGRVSEVTNWNKDDYKIEDTPTGQILRIKLINLKSKNIKKKYLPIPLWKKYEHAFWDNIQLYIDLLHVEDKPFNFSKTRGWQICREVIGCNTHYIRHIRVTHLRLIHNVRPEFIQLFAGWKDLQPYTAYAEFRWYDIAEGYTEDE